jgi:hypothetical protein
MLDVTTTFRPIETPYAGRLFRSRLEARWAVFYSAIGIAWTYEPEGYVLDNTDPTLLARLHQAWDDPGLFAPTIAYLPDFYLPEQRCYVEIKPEPPTEEAGHKARLLAQQTGRRVFIFFGQPGYHSDGGYPYGQLSADSAHLYRPDDGWDNFYCWCVCPTCGRFGIEFDGRSARLPCGHGAPGDDKSYTNADPRLLQAYDRANRARFTR